MTTATRAQPSTPTRRWGSLYVAEHRLRDMRAYAQTIVLTSIGTPLVYLFALGVGLASLVEESFATGDGRSVDYLTFVAPALLASAAVMVAAQEFTYPVLSGFKWNPVFYGMNASPVSPKQIVNGVVLAVSLRLLVTVAIYYGIMVAFGAVPGAWGWLNIVSGVLTGLAVGLPIAAYSCTLHDVRGQLELVMRFGIVPMFLFSGTFFPLDVLPWFLRWIGWVAPLWHGAQLGRESAFGLAEPLWLAAVHVLYLGALAVVGLLLTQRVVSRRLTR